MAICSKLTVQLKTVFSVLNMQRTLKWMGKLPYGLPDFRQRSCDSLCDKCIVRFKCYTLLQGETLLLEDGEWQQLWYILEAELRARNTQKKAHVYNQR